MTDPQQLPPGPSEVTLICRTSGCINENVRIVVTTDATVAVCGVCGQLIRPESSS